MKKLLSIVLLTGSAALLQADPYYCDSCSRGYYNDYNYDEYNYDGYNYNNYPYFSYGNSNQYYKDFDQNMRYNRYGYNSNNDQNMNMNDQYGYHNGDRQTYNRNSYNANSNQNSKGNLYGYGSSDNQNFNSQYGYNRGSGYGDTSMGQNSDQKLTADVQDSLHSAFSDKYNNVNVSAQGGYVTLTGTVESQSDKNDLEKKVSKMEGVRGVNNQVTVNQ